MKALHLSARTISVLSLLTTLFPAPVTAAEPAAGVQASFAMESARLTLHEPVRVEFHVDNRGHEAVKLELGRDRKGSFSFKLRRPDGSITSLPPLPLREGLFDLGRVSVAAGTQFTHRLILNEWTTFATAGSYEVQVQLMTPVEPASGAAIKVQPYRASFEILGRDEARLQRVCETLVQQIKGSKSVREAKDAALTLAYVDDPVAVPYLEQALDSGKYVEGPVIDGLVRIGTMSAVQVLLKVVEASPRWPPDTSTAVGSRAIRAGQALETLASASSNEEVRAAIRQAIRRQ